MSEDSKAREDITRFAKSIFDRGLTCGSSGDISVRLSDGTLLVTPTGSSMGFLDPAQISHLSAKGQHLAGDAPTKEVSLHPTHSVALSMLPDINPDNVLPPLTPYTIMQLGKVKLLPFSCPATPAWVPRCADLRANAAQSFWPTMAPSLQANPRRHSLCNGRVGRKCQTRHSDAQLGRHRHDRRPSDASGTAVQCRLRLINPRQAA